LFPLFRLLLTPSPRSPYGAASDGDREAESTAHLGRRRVILLTRCVGGAWGDDRKGADEDVGEGGWRGLVLNQPTPLTLGDVSDKMVSLGGLCVHYGG
jgi:hypothetical protein